MDRFVEMRRTGAALVVMSMSLALGACSGAGADKTVRPVSVSSHAARESVEREAAVQALIDKGANQGYLNDGDGDGVNVSEARGYHDTDDNPLSFSTEARVASAYEARTITALVRRYFAAVAAGDAKRACSMLPTSAVAAMPVTYGKFGPSYLHGAKTCQAVVTRIFKHARGEWSGRVAVTGVVVMNAEHTAAMLGSAKAPASIAVFQREGGGWRVVGPLPSPVE
jgi:ketosteroid isomerase-like protein